MSRRLLVAGVRVLGVLAVALAAYFASTSFPCGASTTTARLDEGRWTQAPPLPTARSELAAAVLDGKLYAAGGLDGASASVAFEVYDPALGAWHSAAPLPHALHHLGLAALDGRVYVTGGYTDLSFGQLSAAVWAYDPDRDFWEAVASLPASRAAHTTAALDGRLFVAGGVPDAAPLWAYDPAAGVWEIGLAPMPTAREHLASAVVEGKWYVAGGRWSGHGNLAALDVYDPAADAWARLPDMPTARGGLAAAALNGRIVTAGGEDPWARLGTACAYTTVEAYDPASQTWHHLPDLPTPLHGLSSGAVEGTWYIAGGATRPTFGTFFSLSDRLLAYAPDP